MHHDMAQRFVMCNDCGTYLMGFAPRDNSIMASIACDNPDCSQCNVIKWVLVDADMGNGRDLLAAGIARYAGFREEVRIKLKIA